MDVRVEAVPASITFPLRQQVLRTHQAPGQLALPGDDDPDTCHVAALTPAGEVVGTANVRRQAPPWEPGADDTWRLRGMATSPELRGRGIGARLLQSVLAHVDAHGFYEHAGFVTRGEPWIEPDLGPHVVMWRQVTAGA